MADETKAKLWQWLYDNAITGLAAIAFGAWAFNVKDAKTAYVNGQEMSNKAQQQILTNQGLMMDDLRSMQREMVIIRDRQDRNSSVIGDHETRLRQMEMRQQRTHDE